MKKSLFIFYLLVFVFLNATAQNQCNISPSFTAIKTGRSVKFSASGAIDSTANYSWDFNDEPYSSSYSYYYFNQGQTINHTFPASGTYKVCLRLSQPNSPTDTCYALFCDTITIKGPDCNFSAGFSLSQQSDRSVTFSGNSSSNSNGQYDWNFGDGMGGSGQNITHTFPSSGTYNVCVTFSQVQTGFPYDTCFVNYCDTVIIAKPACNISASFNTNAISNKTFSFSGNSSSNTGQYYWNFGDGTSDSGQNVNHTFSSPGTYNVCMTFAQGIPNFPYDSCFASFCNTITATGPDCNISASFTSDTIGGMSVSFSGTGSPNSESEYTWNFGDGTPITFGQHVYHTYTSAGSYSVCLNINQIDPNFPKDTCQAFSCQNINVGKPDCTISTNFTTSTQNRKSRNFSASGATNTTGVYYWNFGDGFHGEGQNVNHTFPDAGTYNVCLRLIQPQGDFMNDTCIAYFCDSTTIADTIAVPNCNISANFNAVTSGDQSLSFSGNSFPNTAGSYSWDFGDGTGDWGQNVNHTFPSSGSYNVCVTFRRDQPNLSIDSCVVVYCQTINIVQPCNISTSFTTSASQSRRLKYFSASGATNTTGVYYWNFGDGFHGEGQNVNHTFPDAGTYNVCLRLIQPQGDFMNDTCIAYFCDSIAIADTIAVPNCNISANFNAATSGDQSLSFSGNSFPNTAGSYSWDFGDGTGDWGQNVNHTFPSSGSYNVCVTFRRDQPNLSIDSCVVVYCQTVNIAQPCNISTSFTTSVSSGNSLSFLGTSSSNTAGNEYSWNFGDGTTASGQNVNHTFPASGVYQVCLTFIRNQQYLYDSCIAVSCDSIRVGNISGISNKINGSPKSNISVYPSPASDKVNYELANENGNELNVEILNTFGEVIKRETNRNGNFIEINLLPPGLYILRIITDNKVYIKEFVKN
jgi:PKD repeat protein